MEQLAGPPIVDLQAVVTAVFLVGGALAVVALGLVWLRGWWRRRDDA